jgi:hypothetical protein
VDVSTLANPVNAIAVTAGVIFAAVQIHHYRQRQRRDAMLELVRSFQDPAFASALRRINSLPDGANREKIRELLGPDGEDAVFLIGLTWESIGVLVYRREVTFDLVADFWSGSSPSRGGNCMSSSTKTGAPSNGRRFGSGFSARRANDRTREETAAHAGASCSPASTPGIQPC